MATAAKVSLWDNSTHGLDASTSVRFGKSLREYTQSGRRIAMAALYQASDDLVNLFDKVTVLHQGHQVFFGTIDEAKEYFSSLGFQILKRQSITEFLIGVTDPSLSMAKEGWEYRVPRTVDDFDKCWKESPNWRKLQEDIKDRTDEGLHDAGLQNFASRSQNRSVYALSWSKQL